LSPIARIPLHTNFDGSYAGPAIDLDSKHSLVYIRQSGSDFGAWAWVRWQAPTIAALAVPLLSLVLLVALVRVLRKRQEYGHYYCRGCNYDLTAPGGMPPDASSRCPECGADLTRRPARLGRSAKARLWKLGVGVVVGLIACAVVLGVTLEPLRPGVGVQPWLAPLTRHLPLPPLQRSERRDSWDEHHVWAYALPRGELKSSFELKLYGFNDAGLSPDGRWYVALRGWRAGPEGRVLIKDMERGTDREVDLQTQPGTSVLLVGFSSDSTKAYIHTIETRGVTAPFVATLREMTIADGSMRVVGRHAASYTQGPRGMETPTQRFVIRESDGRLRWALFMHRGYGGTTASPTVKADVVTEAGTTYPVEFPGSSWYEPWLNEDASTLNVPVYGTSTVAKIKLADGTLTQTPGGAGPDVVGGSLTLRFVSSGSPATGTIHVLDKAGATIATLDPGPGLTAFGPAISRDGRLAAGITHETGRSLLGQPTLQPKVLVWDLSPLLKQEKEQGP
jgi:hypothetical protein